MNIWHILNILAHKKLKTHFFSLHPSVDFTNTKQFRKFSYRSHQSCSSTSSDDYFLTQVITGHDSGAIIAPERLCCDYGVVGLIANNINLL